MGAIVVIAASAGGFRPLLRVIAALPAGCAASVFVTVHIGPYPTALPDLLNRVGMLPAAFGQDSAPIEPGRVYVAPPDHHMLLAPTRVRLNHGPKVHNTRPAADPLFISAAKVFGERVVGIVLGGGGSDGAAGLRTIKEHGGLAFVQQPKDAEMAPMPLAAIVNGHPDGRLSIEEITQRVRLLCSAN
jgi:two-component system chemotaxis response regulator CheB